MPDLSESKRIEILMMIGFGDRRRTHQEVCDVFNDIHPKLYKGIPEVAVANLSNSGRSKIATNEDVAQNIARIILIGLLLHSPTCIKLAIVQ
ncbi:hypothetical protein ILUMI_02785 [Ignelater luminosus]|uniref:Uncharacterized protein n=1 Tax=Ignelater luminosus TaxID=2038154 RepID=A0A8K0DH13_IGNLU|nr:hypothetical protein ILUMI_02785 [Ignelater luminosus]